LDYIPIEIREDDSVMGSISGGGGISGFFMLIGKICMISAAVLLLAFGVMYALGKKNASH